MLSIQDVVSAVDGLSSTSAERGELLTRMVDEHAARDVLVLGFERGVATCYISAALDRRGEGHVVTIGRADKIAESPSIEDLLAQLSLTDRATVFFEYDGYNWRLYHFLAQRPRPQFDLILINGRHYWDADGFAFLLAEQLLAPGGHVIFAALNWTIAGSRTLSSQTANLPEDLRNAQHVKLICEELVKPHPNITEYWEDSRWGFAHKRGHESRIGHAARDAALEVMREQAMAVRRRAEQAWKSERWEMLAAVHPLTGVRLKPARAYGARPELMQ